MKRTAIQTRVSPQLLGMIDSRCAELKLNRSEFVAYVLADYLSQVGSCPELQELETWRDVSDEPVVLDGSVGSSYAAYGGIDISLLDGYVSQAVQNLVNADSPDFDNQVLQTITNAVVKVFTEQQENKNDELIG